MRKSQAQERCYKRTRNMLHHPGAKDPEAHVCELPEGRNMRCWWPDIDEKKIELSQVVTLEVRGYLQAHGSEALRG